MESNLTSNDKMIVITKSPKSAGISILLTLLFGSIGMFYSTISGGLIMTFLVPPIMLYLFFTAKWIAFFVVALIYYPICIIWGYNATRQYNANLFLNTGSVLQVNKTENKETAELSLYDIIQTGLIVLFFLCFLYAIVTLVFK